MKRIFTVFKKLSLALALISPFYALAEDKKITQDDVDRFSRALVEIHQYYVQEITEQQILENALDGMLAKLDPHSEYLNKDDYKRLTESTNGEFAGLGLELTTEKGLVKVVSPLDGTPAAKAGIKSGDYIIEVDDKALYNISLDDAVNMMRGPQGSTIALRVMRNDETEPLSFKIKRDIVKVDSVKSKLLDSHYGYIQLTQFQRNTGDNLKDAIVTLQHNAGGKLNGLILDLRNNPGGLLDAAVQVSNMFLHSNNLTSFNKKIVYTKGRTADADMEALADSNDILNSAPLVILINSGSASASEIVAGALQDYQRAVIVGEKSFGKGSVQTVIPLDEQHAIKLTTALYYTPSGRVIQAKGIEPDILVEDLKLKKDNSEAIILQPIRESNFSKHLSGSPEDTTKKSSQKNEPTEGLVYTDYQLHESLNLLKALHVMNQKLAKELKDAKPTSVTSRVD